MDKLVSSSQQTPWRHSGSTVKLLLSFSSTFYICLFCTKLALLKHILPLDIPVKLEKNTYVPLCFVKVFLRSSHRLTFAAVLWHVLCDPSGSCGPDK